MKRQLFAICFAAASMGAFSLAAPAQAIPERELNGTSRLQDIGKVLSALSSKPS